MSTGSVYDLARRGDYSQVKVRVQQDGLLVRDPDAERRLLIHWAALSGNNDLVELLLELHSPVDPVDETGVTPLILAASAGRHNIVRLLLGRNANINKKTDRGTSALQYACSKGFKEVAQLLIESGADINIADVLGATPLHRAASQGRANIVELLLSYSNSLNVNVKDNSGDTPLHLACEEDRESVALMLVKAGADCTVKNVQGKTPLDVCIPKLKKSILACTGNME